MWRCIGVQYKRPSYWISTEGERERERKRVSTRMKREMAVRKKVDKLSSLAKSKSVILSLFSFLDFTGYTGHVFLSRFHGVFIEVFFCFV